MLTLYRCSNEQKTQHGVNIRPCCSNAVAILGVGAEHPTTRDDAYAFTNPPTKPKRNPQDKPTD